MLQGVHVRRCGAWASTSYGAESRNEITGRRTQLGNFGRMCQCTGAMSVACPLPNLALPETPQLYSFRKRVAGEIGMKRANGRVPCIVMAGQRDKGGGDGITEDLREDVIVSSLVTEAPQVQGRVLIGVLIETSTHFLLQHMSRILVIFKASPPKRD